MIENLFYQFLRGLELLAEAMKHPDYKKATDNIVYFLSKKRASYQVIDKQSVSLKGVFKKTMTFKHSLKEIKQGYHQAKASNEEIEENNNCVKQENRMIDSCVGTFTHEFAHKCLKPHCIVGKGEDQTPTIRVVKPNCRRKL